MSVMRIRGAVNRLSQNAGKERKYKSSTIYICTTYYHLYIALAKILTSEEISDIALTHYIPDHEHVLSNLKKNTLISNVYDIPYIEEYKPKNRLDRILNFHKMNKISIEQQLPFDITVYGEIYIFHDDTCFAHYLKEKKISYYLSEDALDSFKIIDQTKFSYMIQDRDSIKYFIRKILNYGYFYFSESPCVISIEVNDTNGIKIPRNRVIMHSRSELFAKLTKKNYAYIQSIFNGKNIRYSLAGNLKVLIVTQPLFIDGMVNSMEQQIKIYNKVIKEFQDKKYTVYLKPHPRDDCQYSKCLEQKNIFNKNIPLEILGIDEKFKFDIAISINSTALHSTQIARNIVLLGLEYIDKEKCERK